MNTENNLQRNPFDTKKQANKYPVAPARLVRKKDVWLWVVDKCPLCGKRHTHGGGLIEDDPFDNLGHRYAHCDSLKPEPGGYILVAAREKDLERIKGQWTADELLETVFLDNDGNPYLE